MASQKLIMRMIAGFKNTYQNFGKDADVKLLVDLWGATLQEFPDDITEKAFLRALQTCKFAPVPADIVNIIESMIRANEPSDEQLWSVFTKALREVDTQIYRISYPIPGVDPRNEIQKVWDNLPDKLQQYIGSKGELMRMSSYGDTELKFEKNQFMKTMPAIHTRLEFSGLMLEDKSGDKLLLEK